MGSTRLPTSGLAECDGRSRSHELMLLFGREALRSWDMANYKWSEAAISLSKDATSIPTGGYCHIITCGEIGADAAGTSAFQPSTAQP